MVRRTIRNIDASTNEKLKEKAEQKKISVNDLINIILDRAVVNNEIKTYEESMKNEINRFVLSNNQLIVSIERQTEAINNYTKAINELIR
ncbi:hypothetical protein ERX27_03560 [Macrococcus brunensis]|uniref:Antitoxin FitA-like ribbon-helix-helix domain-containing protein n=1 Tax=Macrococcus brunensis TaxID=198483 RepID=A0A4V3BDS0_9STAP|nr:hypothetical protein [Macrococcus brunensis]TDL98526.1 hypothetical protein ERX27_03560 [Macrococcus brunensis]